MGWDTLFDTASALILTTKLQVFAAEIEERIRLRRKNIDILVREELETGTQIMGFDPHYGIDRYDSHLQQIIYTKRFDLTKEQRQQDVECWRDIVMVMRDFLTASEVHEQAWARHPFGQMVGNQLKEVCRKLKPIIGER